MAAATYQGTTESLKLLLAQGAEARPGTGVLYNASPLMMATMTGDIDSINLLLSKQADPNRKMNLIGMFPTSPLFAAVPFGDPAVVKALIKGGAHVDERDPDQMTALDWAVLANRAPVVKELIAAGAEVNAVDKFGYTPLLYAATVDFGNADTIKPLLEAGADPSIKSKDGKTARIQASGIPHLRAALAK